MNQDAARRGKVTDLHREESRRLKALWDASYASRKQNGLHTQESFGEKYEIGNQAAVGFFLNGKTALSLKAARGFARGLSCEIGAFSPRLAEEAAKNAAFAPPAEADFVEVRRADVAFSNGSGKLVFVEGSRSSLSFRREYLRKIGVSAKNAVIVDAEGRSNDPDIKDGAVLLVNRAPQDIINGKFYAFRKDGELLVKKLTRRADGTILAVSANPDRDEYPDIVIHDDVLDFELVGRVMWMASEL